MKKKLSLLLVLMLTLSMVCGSISTVSAATKPTKMTITATAKTVDIGGTVTVKAKLTPSKASQAVTFKTSNKKIATVSSKGVVTGKKKGKVTITVTSKKNKKLKKTVKITVKKLEPKQVELPEGILIGVGQTKTVTPIMKPVGINKKGTWASSDESIFTVSSSGKITAVGVGTAELSFVATRLPEFTATAEVKVLPLAESCEVTCPDNDGEIVLENMLYPDQLVVLGKSAGYGRVIISNCVLEKGICNKALGGNIVLREGQAEANYVCAIENDLHLTMNDVIEDIKCMGDSAYPKYIMAANKTATVSADGSGLVTIFADDQITFNGKKYTKKDITETYQAGTGEITDAEPAMIFIAQYWDGDECKVGVFGFAM